MNDVYTEDLAEFGYREQNMAMDLFIAWKANGLPDDFYNDGVKIGFNKNSGYVFLTNSDYQCCMDVEGKLESHYSTPYEGHEGFYDDLMVDYDNMHPEDQEFMDSISRVKKVAVNE
tara:strand:+ start:320 stop:667 length:348 start_codon:yes stop_codon:yes gene_type:complete